MLINDSGVIALMAPVNGAKIMERILTIEESVPMPKKYREQIVVFQIINVAMMLVALLMIVATVNATLMIAWRLVEDKCRGKTAQE